MAENVDDPKIEKKIGRSREQRAAPRPRDKAEERQLPVPPPDPWASPWCAQSPRNQPETTQSRSLDEDEDIIAYLTDLGTPPLESQASECPSRNSAASAMAISHLCADDAFEHLDRLYAFTEQILELRSRSSKFFKRVRNLEKLKVLRNVDRRLENAFARDKDSVNDVCDEDTGFAESLLDAMLSNCRDPPFQRRYTRSASRQTRSKIDVEKQTSADEISGSAPKVSKWTRVKAAFKWERACTNDVDAMDTTITSMNKYHRSLDTETGDSNCAIVSSYGNEACDAATPFGRTSSASSSNEGSYDYLQKNLSNVGHQSLKMKNDKKVECANQRSQSLDEDIVAMNIEGDHSPINMGKPLIRVTSEKNHTMHSANRMEERDGDSSSKRFTPTLTITIPSHEEEMRCLSSPDSSSPLPSSAHTSGGNSPQHRKIHRKFSINKDFKRQQSANEDSTVLLPKTQRQNSKWNKVRRAFLTNSTLSVPPNLIRVVSRQMILQDGLEASLAYGYSNSTEDLRKAPLNGQAEARRDYRALREKLGAEFQRKLIEWERLKNLSPRIAAKDTREMSSNFLNPRETLPSEERLAPEFRKKLQDWKRTKKERRGSAPFEQQRINRRRLTDWQLWRSPSKSEYRNKEIAGSRGSCEENGEGKSHLGEDFVRKMEVWKRMNDAHSRDTKQTAQAKSSRLGISSGIDESEFVALERVVSLFDNGIGKGRRESDARRLDECFDGDVRSYEGAQNINDTNEVLIRTSVGSYRFEGISREFTRKLYDWERYRGISPTSSTFRLLGPAYDPFTRNTTIETSTVTQPTTKAENDEPSMFKVSSLKRSKSAGNVKEETMQDEFFIRRSSSLQTLGHYGHRLKDNEGVDNSPVSIDSRRTEEITEDIVMDDSEPEAMIVDIEDVIEETASPLERVQPHQTPVYSVAASETTSIAVPLGTVTSSHEPSPVFLIEIEENEDRNHWESKKWSRRKSFSSEDSLSTEHSETTKISNNKKDDNVDSEKSSITESLNEKKYCIEDNDEKFDQDLDKCSMKSDSLIYSMELDQKCKTAKRGMVESNFTDCEREEMPTVPSDGDNGNASVKEYGLDGIGENESSYERNAGNHFSASIQEMMKKATTANAFSSKVSFTIAQSQLATCRYNQDLSGGKTHQHDDDIHGGDNDTSSDNGKDTAEAKMKCDNEYEEIDLNPINRHCCSSTGVQGNYSEGYESLLESSAERKLVLDEAKYPLSEMGLRRINRDDERFDNHEKNYGVIREELHNRHTCHNPFKLKSNEEKEVQSTNTKQISTAAESIESKEQQYRNFENVFSSLILHSANPSSGEYHREPTVKTTPCTVSPCREERCFERLIVNEETLNKIVVPTASTGCAEQAKSLEGSENSTDRNQASVDPSSNQESSSKKRISPSRNVFIKTKRIIFSPFRKVEEHSANRKESLEDDTFPTKSKSKSRSASPKINRQDVLLRMSLSLPWPLRPSSKDRELKIKESDKEAVESKRKLSNASQTQISKEKNLSIESTDSKESIKSRRVSVSVQATPDQEIVSGSSSSKGCSPKFDPQSSDLMHKLDILSNAVARRDGRTNTISEECIESHSLRIRRAKEDFLSRRGGPLCHSVLEPRSFKDHDFLKASARRHEDILEKQPEGNEELDANGGSKLEEVSAETEESRMDLFGNDNTVVSRPDRVKSASVGMINVDPDTFVRLTESNRGCESLPRSIVKQQEPSGPFAKIVNKLKFTKFIRGRDVEEGSMNTISKLCRQSLLIDLRNDVEKSWEGDESKGISVENVSQIKKGE